MSIFGKLKSCDIRIFDQPWTKTRRMHEPVCQDIQDQKKARGFYIISSKKESNNITSLTVVTAGPKNQNSIAVHTLFFNLLGSIWG